MKVVFFGTDTFSLSFLEDLYDSNLIAAVVTRSEKPKGRSLKPKPSPVKQRALELGLEVIEQEDLKESSFLQKLKKLDVPLGVVAAYGRIIPPEVLAVFKNGCINVHPSLLPLYRGPAPVQRAVIEGEKKSGVSIIKVASEVDAGDVFIREEFEIGEDETAGDVFEKAAVVGGKLLLKVISEIEEGTAEVFAQDHSAATAAYKILPEETLVKWSGGTTAIRNLIRGLNPKPAAYTFFRGKRLKLLLPGKIEKAARQLAPGRIMLDKERLLISCGGGDLLEILELQPEGKRAMKAPDFIRGYRPREDESFG